MIQDDQPKSKFDLAIVIPCYNEESRVSPTFRAYFDYFSNQPTFEDKKIALIFVDDGSQDKTGEIIKNFEKFSNERLFVRALGYNLNQGKGNAIKIGCAEVTAKIYGFVDADLSFRPELIERALSFLSEADFDLVIGQRNEPKINSFGFQLRHFFSKLLRKIINSFLAIPDLDTQCGFKFFNEKIATTILPKIKQNRFAFDVEFILLSLQQHYQLKPLPVNFEPKNKSSIIWKDGIRYILDMVSISEQLNFGKLKKFFARLFAMSAVITVLVFGWVVFKGFLFSDDFTWLWHGQKIGNSIFSIMTFRMSTFYSPVMNAFYSVMYSIFHYNPQPLSLVGIIIHIFVSTLAGIFIWQLSRSKLIATTTTFLVAFAGGAYEPLVWIGANMHSVVTLFILVCLIFYYQYLSTQKNIYLWPSFLFFILALGTKESAIVTPILMAVLFLYHRQTVEKLPKSNALFYAGIILLSTIYLYIQYLWQKNSIWVEAGVWNINLVSFLRIPLIALDNFIPISFLRLELGNYSAVVLWLFSVFFIFFILYKFRKIKLMWLGFFWLLISISPFIFFKTEFWWEPLASRYNYLPRIGAIIIIAAILQHLIINNKARHIINSLICLVLVSITAQLYFMVDTITSEYGYVYNAGRSLTRAMQEIDKMNPPRVFVRWDYPFTGNNAHIIGAASIIANIHEGRMIFLKRDEAETLGSGEVLLYWNHKKIKYEILTLPDLPTGEPATSY